MAPGTILLVDDNAQILYTSAELLRPLGYSIVSALSGAEALAIATAQPPDLVLLDVMMPGMDGYSVCRAMRAHPRLAAVPILLVTALDDRESRLRGFEAGADEFVSKPFDYVELRARVSTILGLNRYRQLLAEQARVAAERARFVWAVEQSADGILILDPDGYPRYLNPRARHMLKLAPDAPIERPFLAMAAEHYAPVPPEAWANWFDASSDPNQLAPPRFLVRHSRRAGQETWLHVELLPPSEGDNARVLCLRDVTEQVSSQREMWTFHAIIGHKLRTPLMSILGGLNILVGGASTMDRTSIARIAGVALDGARRLRAEIEDIFHYLHPPDEVADSPGPAVAELANLATTLASELGIDSFTIDVAESALDRQIGLNHQSAEVLLREVLENTQKFHPTRAPTVHIALECADANTLLLRVGDNGPGVPADQLDLVWQPYFQGERSFTGQVEGMGLGLALVARIVYATGGRCAVANRPDGPGLLVTIHLPLVERS